MKRILTVCLAVAMSVSLAVPAVGLNIQPGLDPVVPAAQEQEPIGPKCEACGGQTARISTTVTRWGAYGYTQCAESIMYKNAQQSRTVFRHYTCTACGIDKLVQEEQTQEVCDHKPFSYPRRLSTVKNVKMVTEKDPVAVEEIKPRTSCVICKSTDIQYEELPYQTVTQYISCFEGDFHQDTQRIERTNKGYRCNSCNYFQYQTVEDVGERRCPQDPWCQKCWSGRMRRQPDQHGKWFRLEWDYCNFHTGQKHMEEERDAFKVRRCNACGAEEKELFIESRFNCPE